MKMIGTRNWGMLLLGIWLVITGLKPFLHLSFVDTGLISAVVALAAGVLILLGR